MALHHDRERSRCLRSEARVVAADGTKQRLRTSLFGRCRGRRAVHHHQRAQCCKRVESNDGTAATNAIEQGNHAAASRDVVGGFCASLHEGDERTTGGTHAGIAGAVAKSVKQHRNAAGRRHERGSCSVVLHGSCDGFNRAGAAAVVAASDVEQRRQASDVDDDDRGCGPLAQQSHEGAHRVATSVVVAAEDREQRLHPTLRRHILRVSHRQQPEGARRVRAGSRVLAVAAEHAEKRRHAALRSQDRH
mmetsp:Transcript_8465/g.30092  ORF Transcript_8465/g.30092 Transcript_8465/m.30092 type:complete len:248 (-) Transcript_8465:355-1098(-)